jgi:Ran-binding protein 9/10
MTNGSGSGPGTRQSGPPAAQPAGPSLLPARRSSYASVVSGATPRSGALLHLVSAPTGSPHQHHTDYRHSRQLTGQESETNPNGAVPFGSSWRKATPLPSYSRQFANMPGHASNGYGSQNTFFIPSYLRNSRYVAKLEAAHKAKIAAQREHTSPHSSNPASLSTSSSNVNLHRMAPSHRGMTYDIIEHPLPGEDESLMPLPSKWSDEEKNAGLDVLGEGLEIRYNGPSSKTDMDAAAARADYPMSPQCGIYYFEVEIKNKSREGMIAVGFSTRKASLERLPGWETESWAYHGDDGKIFFGESTGKNYNAQFTINDIIGCGINFWTGCAFFTKNGLDLGVAFRELKNVRPFPSVGMKKHSGAWVSVNFGQRPFVFDIDGMMAREQMAVESEIMATKPTSLRPPSDEDTLIQELVAHFLAHDGYVETAKAFASERRAASAALRGTQDSSPGAIDVEDDLDAVNRQSEFLFHGITLLLTCLFRNSSRNTRRRYRQSSKAYPCVLSTCA